MTLTSRKKDLLCALSLGYRVEKIVYTNEEIEEYQKAQHNITIEQFHGRFNLLNPEGLIVDTDWSDTEEKSWQFHLDYRDEDTNETSIPEYGAIYCSYVFSQQLRKRVGERELFHVYITNLMDVIDRLNASLSLLLQTTPEEQREAYGLTFNLWEKDKL